MYSLGFSCGSMHLHLMPTVLCEITVWLHQQTRMQLPPAALPLHLYLLLAAAAAHRPLPPGLPHAHCCDLHNKVSRDEQVVAQVKERQGAESYRLCCHVSMSLQEGHAELLDAHLFKHTFAWCC
jgi:hypothetical protein